MKLIGPKDGHAAEYCFGSPEHSTTPYWRVTATSLARAVRAFRVGALFPHQYTEGRIKTSQTGADGYDAAVYLASASGSTVGVYTMLSVPVEEAGSFGGPSRTVHRDRLVEVARIPPEATTDEAASLQALGLLAHHGDRGLEPVATTALVLAGAAAGVDSAPRVEIERRMLDLQAQQGRLELERRALSAQVAAMQAEVKRRMEQIWLIELFLGSHEEVLRLAAGTPAPAGTPISVFQRVLCMDEELAVYDYTHNEGRLRAGFDAGDLDGFDRWLLLPGHLDAILPAPKGIVALRVRRREKRRTAAEGYDGLRGIMQSIAEAEADRMTYLLVRNGENVYRLWVDVSIWPRFFPRLNEWETGPDPDPFHRAEDAQRKDMQRFAAGLLVVQGLLERSDLFAPMPAEKINVFNPADSARHFRLVRDDEDRKLLGDGNVLSRLTWSGYRTWLREQLHPGCRVQWIGRPEHRSAHDRTSPLEERTGLRTVRNWPSNQMLYSVEPSDNTPQWRPRWTFLYDEESTVYTQDSAERRSRRVRFSAYAEEVIPFDRISWRVLDHLLHDRSQRRDYAEFFVVLMEWSRMAKAEAALERSFVDLVLQQHKISPRRTDVEAEASRARVERLLRWWKTKTQVHRTITVDEAKALRMISGAFAQGQDHPEDPEVALLQHLRGD